MLDESTAFSPEAEDQELTGSSEQDLPFWLLPPLAASTFMLLPHALRVLRDSPAGTTGFKRLISCYLLSVWSLLLTFLLLYCRSDHLSQLPSLPPLFLHLRLSFRLVERPVMCGPLPRWQPVQRGDTLDVVVLPGSVFSGSWTVGKEPASPDTPLGPQTVLTERQEWRRHPPTSGALAPSSQGLPVRRGTSSAS